MTEESRECGAAVLGTSYWRGCKRLGHETHVNGKRAIRCWQHDPLRSVDEGKEAYREHQWT